MTIKKTAQEFIERLRQDKRFCSFIEFLSPEDLARFLGRQKWTNADWEDVIAALRKNFTKWRDPSAVDELKAVLEGLNTGASGYRGMRLNEEYLVECLDPVKSVAALKLYNMGAKQRIVIPCGQWELLFDLERKDAPEIPEDSATARERVAALLVDLAEKRAPGVRIAVIDSDAPIIAGKCDSCGTILTLTPHMQEIFEMGADFVVGTCPSCKRRVKLARPPEVKRKSS